MTYMYSYISSLNYFILNKNTLSETNHVYYDQNFKVKDIQFSLVVIYLLLHFLLQFQNLNKKLFKIYKYHFQ